MPKSIYVRYDFSDKRLTKIIIAKPHGRVKWPSHTSSKKNDDFGKNRFINKLIDPSVLCFMSYVTANSMTPPKDLIHILLHCI